MAVDEPAAAVPQDPGGSGEEDREEGVRVGAILRSQPQRDRGVDPHAEDGQDHPQVRAPVPTAGARRPRPANHTVHSQGRVDHHPRLPVGREGSRTLRGERGGMWGGGGAGGWGDWEMWKRQLFYKNDQCFLGTWIYLTMMLVVGLQVFRQK